MLSKALEALPDGSYVAVRISGGERETTRLLGISSPTAEERNYGYKQKRVYVRRFLTGGYLDIQVSPRDVLLVVHPTERILRIFAFVESEVGEKRRQEV